MSRGLYGFEAVDVIAQVGVGDVDACFDLPGRQASRLGQPPERGFGDVAEQCSGFVARVEHSRGNHRFIVGGEVLGCCIAHDTTLREHRRRYTSTVRMIRLAMLATYRGSMRPQTPVGIRRLARITQKGPPNRGWRSGHGQDCRPVASTYVDDVPTTPPVRKRAFAAFVKRATDHAKLHRGWSIRRVAEESGIGPNTIYRWLRGDWTTAPDPDLIEKFCDALDIPTSAAFVILWPGKGWRAELPEPMPSDPDFDLLQRRLNDPKTPGPEKFLIRETIKSLAIRGR